MQRGVWAGEQIEALLRERGMTQEQLAVASGLRRTDVNRYVRNRQRLGIVNAEKIARALSVTPDDLGVTDTNDSRPPSAEQLERIEELLVEAQQRLERIERRMDHDSRDGRP